MGFQHGICRIQKDPSINCFGKKDVCRLNKPFFPIYISDELLRVLAQESEYFQHFVIRLFIAEDKLAFLKVSMLNTNLHRLTDLFIRALPYASL